MHKDSMTTRRSGFPKGVAGFSLMEVLVAVLILAIGLLGLAGLQSTAMKQTHSAATRSKAAVLAYDMVDRMRANLDAVDAGRYDVTFAGNGTAGTAAGNDIRHWKAELADSLPSGEGQIQVGALGGNFYQITVDVRWDDQRLENVDDLTTFQMQTRVQI